MAINKVVLVGKVGQYGAKITWTDAGKPQTTFSLELEEFGKEGASFRTYVPVMVIGANAEQCAEGVEPGDVLCVDGKLSYQRGKTPETRINHIPPKTSVKRFQPQTPPRSGACGSDRNGTFVE